VADWKPHTCAEEITSMTLKPGSDTIKYSPHALSVEMLVPVILGVARTHIKADAIIVLIEPFVVR
tara:strand:+ start:314 stop:508 length:195 start_codon:yes stop_codon:yes gene_type:complete